MRCEICELELTDETICPACETPVAGVNQPANLSKGSISLARPVESFLTTMLRLVFLADCSGSMGGDKWSELNAGLKQMTQGLLPLGDKCLMGVVEFSDSARIAHPMTNPSGLVEDLSISEARGGTHIGASIRLAGTMLTDHSIENDFTPVVVVMSDGEETGHSMPTDEATKLRADGVTIVAIGYGDDADHDLLRSLASSPELYFAKGANGGKELEAFLKKLGDNLTKSVQCGQSVVRTLRSMS